MTRGSGRTQSCGAADARTRLAQARKFLEVAELVADEDIEASHSVAAALAVLAVVTLLHPEPVLSATTGAATR